MARVLVVEDDLELAQLVAEVLTLEGHEAQYVTDSSTAAARCAEYLPDVVLLDYVMQPLSGAEVYQQLQQNARTVPIPVVLMSAVPQIEERSAEMGITHVLSKPVEITDLLAALESVCIAA